MARIITTSLVVSFSDPKGAGGILKAEIDNRDPAEGGLNLNGTTFYPGDEPIFLIFATSDVTITRLELSEGSISALGNTTVNVDNESVTFANVREASLNYPVSSGFNVDASSPGAPTLTLSGEAAVTIPANAVAAYRVSYVSVARAYRIVGASGLLDVVVYVEGTTEENV